MPSFPVLMPFQANTPLVCGFGRYVPPRVVSNDDLALFVDTNDAWITSRTGIRQRHFAEGAVCNADLGLMAARDTLARTGIPTTAITHILYGTCTADAAFPSTACILASRLGISGALAVDVNAACASFVYALEMARGLVAATPEAVVLVVATDILSKRLNWEDRSTCVLFGDGSSAAIVAAPAALSGNTLPDIPAARLLDVACGSDGSLGHLLQARGGFSSHPYKMGETVGPEYFLQMQGREVFKHAVRNMTEASRAILQRNHLAVDAIDVVVPHQANLRIIEAVCQRLGVESKKIFINVDTMGNTSAASIPLALSEALDTGAIVPGNRVLVVTFGAGFTWAAAILQF